MGEAKGRHTAATLMLEGGADIRFIQALLGHAELTSTEIYTQVSIRKLPEIHAATHPGARLGRARPPAEGSVPDPEDPHLALLEALDQEAAEEGEEEDAP